MSKNNEAMKDSVPALPDRQIIWKGAKEFRHDLYKLQIADMNKNVSYQKYQPRIEQIPHLHFFHSHDMKGRVLKYSQSVGGHFHEVTVDWNKKGKDGGPLIVCGPALREITKRLKNGKMKTIIEKVRYASGDAVEDEDGTVQEVTFVYDKHTHDVSYEASEMISPEKIRRAQETEKAKVQAMIASTPAPAQTTSAHEKGLQDAGDGKQDLGDGVTITES